MPGRKIEPRQVRKLPRPHPDPHVEWHLQMYDKINAMAYGMHLIRRPTFLNLANDDLGALGITIGPRLDVDGESIDLEPSFFTPSPREEIQSIIVRSTEMGDDIWPEIGYRADRLYRFCEHPYPKREQWQHAYTCIGHADEVHTVLDNLVGDTRKRTWAPFGGSLGKDIQTKIGYAEFRTDHTIDGVCEEEDIYTESQVKTVLFVKKGSKGRARYPHVVVELGQTQTPPEDIPTRHEIHQASRVLLYMLLNRHWLGHHTLPMLMFSYHGHGCRILQIHQRKGEMVVRMSRMLNLTRHRYRTITDDARTVLQWLLSKPVGETRFGQPKVNGMSGFDAYSGRQEHPPLTVPLSANDGDDAESVGGEC